MDAEKWRGGSRDENADLVDCVVRWVEGSIFFERGFLQRKQECRRNALVNGVFCNVD